MAISQKILPVGVQNFESLIKDGYLYVDKTQQIWNLTHAGRHYFLSRPRRFGKSLLISTLEAYFQGKHDLFDGLYIQDVETEWATFPIFHVDLSPENFTSADTLRARLDWHLTRWENVYGKEDVVRSLSERFENCIMRAVEKTGQRVVILVDEYDKPILSAIDNPQLQDEMRAVLKAFYGVLKSQDGNIRFSLLTGVTKFSKVSIFSDLNNLNDISRDRRYYDICGISQAEMDTVMRPYLEDFATIHETTYAETVATFRRMYDGYRFTSFKQQGIYNPFSVLSALDRGEFGNYWFETGTPNHIVELLQKKNYALSNMTDHPVDAATLDSKDDYGQSIVPLLFQSGYLTISDYLTDSDLYQLDFPNDEVRSGFFRFILPTYTSVKKEESAYVIEQFVREVQRGDAEAFMSRLNSFLADYQYDAQCTPESHFQNVIYVLCKLLNIQVEAEYRTSDGRIDLLIRTAKFVYIIECKLNSSAEVALNQINTKNYALPWTVDAREVIIIGVNFSSLTRRATDWMIKSVEKKVGTRGKESAKSVEKKVRGKESVEKTGDRIREAMKASPKITVDRLADYLSVPSRTIEDNISRLKKSGKIQRLGGRKDGYWRVLE